ncbi:unnamed protein product [Hydatigera taeniaeformis]|uniref:Claudin n=1 Tax=Hydatigena taeniaeformis TaxID=6205 RepID=A0A0R3WJK4_HYDTA|nr:unnamed protein product [Hydatigera taeniaeformis]
MRAARKLWVILVTLGAFCVLAAIATNLAAVILPHWMEYSKTSAVVYSNRGLFQNCMGKFEGGIEINQISHFNILQRPVLSGSYGSECLEISSPLHPYWECLRLTDWALQVTALGLGAFVTFACISYLLVVRYCMSKPSAQSAQSCLVISGYLLWLSAILTILGIISFEGSSILESITTNIDIKGMTGSLPANDWKTLEENYGVSSHLSWASVALGMAGSWFWIVASFVQPPPHITSPSMLALSSSSTVPLYPLTQKQSQ